jgi:ABC-type sugar transport system ATPase subunit
MVAGLETITGGEIDIGGRVVNQIEPADRDIAMVFQNYALYPHMSVYNNMAYGLRNRGMAEPEIKTRGGGSRAHSRTRRDARAQAAAIVRRPAPARGDGPRHRAAAES